MATHVPFRPLKPRRIGIHRRTFWLAVAIAVLAGGLAVLIDRAVSGGSSPSRPSIVKRELAGLVDGPGRVAPGAIAYVDGPRGVWAGAAGVAVIGKPMEPNTRVRLNSVSKMWTATLILKLVEQHKLTLGDTVSHWLPGLLPYGRQINVQELLSMTSGMVDTNDFQDRPMHYLARLTDPALRARMVALAGYIKTHPNYQPSTQLWLQLAAASPLLSAPGTTWHYSNIGYIVAGMIAAKAAGASLSTLFDRLIIDPMHLTSTRYNPEPKVIGAHAHGYGVFPKWKLEDITALTGGEAANDGIVTDAADEAHFLKDLMQGKILKFAELEALETPYSTASYGLGVGVSQDGCADEAQVFGHEGAGGGYMSAVQVSPDGKRVAVVLLNGFASTITAQNHEESVMVDAMKRLYCAN